MTNRIALGLGGLIAAAVAVDALLGAPVTLYVAREFLWFIEWLAFWR